MKRVFYHVLLLLSRAVRIFGARVFSDRIFKLALEFKGVQFVGNPNYIDYNTYLDPIGGLILGNNVVISTNVIILTHDYSYTAGLISILKRPVTDIATVSSVTVGSDCFIGAGAVILPGSKIGSNVIVGAGSVVKGDIQSNSIVAGNPAKKIHATDEWARSNESKFEHLLLIIDKK